MRHGIALVRYVFLAAALLFFLFPIYWMASLAFRSGEELRSALSFLPQDITFAHFAELFAKNNFGKALINSLTVAAASVGISMALGLTSAYGLSKTRFRFALKGPTLLVSFLVRILPPIAFAVPLYIVMNNMKLLNSHVPVTTAHILLNLPFVMWLMIGFYKNVPQEMDESAKVDGAGEWTIFYRIFLPMVLPGIGAAAIFSFLTSWNEYLFSVIFVQSPAYFTAPVSLSVMNSEQELTQWGAVAAGGLLSMVPAVLFVVFAQKLLIQGLTSGSVKE